MNEASQDSEQAHDTEEMETTPVVQESNHEKQVSRFASSLGTNSGASFTGAGSNALLKCLSSSVAADTVVCSLPSLDMPPLEQKEGSKGSPLPEVGQHHEKVPEMAASVLNNATATTDTSNAEQLEQEAARHLATLTSWTKSSLIYAPHAINKNVSGALSSLIDSRVRAWTLLLLRHSLSSGDGASRSRLLGMLSCSATLKSTTTTFKTLPLPESARGQPKEADVILPLLFEAELELSIQNKVDTVKLRAPGTIAGTFAKNGTEGLTKVDVRLDTGALLESMIEQARLAVFRAVARATSVSQDKPTVPATATPTAAAALAGFNSSLDIAVGEPPSSQQMQPPQEVQQIAQVQKARTSALRLNNILQGKQDEPPTDQDVLMPLEKPRKTRSVKWLHPMHGAPTRDLANFPLAKRQRMGQSRLRSTKSFGRPHAEHGAGPRNATFGDFGTQQYETWGKDGRLKNHPVPGGGMASRLSAFNRSDAPMQNQNAMFDLQQRSKVSASTLEALGLGSSGSTASSTSTGGGASLPRTATALENWLVNATKGGSASGML